MKKQVKGDIIKFLFLAGIGSVEQSKWIDNSINQACLDFYRIIISEENEIELMKIAYPKVSKSLYVISLRINKIK